MLLFLVLAGGWYFLDQQRQAQRQQLDAIDLNVQCVIAGGGVVNRGGTNVCVDAAGRIVDLPAK